MALGGGNFLTHNKILPGSYINFVSLSRASVNMAERGYVAMPLELNWGKENEIIVIENGEFAKKSLELLGYASTSEELKKVREVMQNAKTLYLYRLSKNANKATNKWATALYGGTRGNDILIKISRNLDENSKFDVSTVVGDTVVDMQTVATNADLKSNKFVTFKTTDNLEVHTGLALTGGTNGISITGLEYQSFLDKIESYYFNILTTVSTEDSIKKLFEQFTRRMRDEVGAKFQTVLYRHLADFEGVISFENKTLNDTESLGVLWLSGILASCDINKSITNKKYNGEYEFEFKENQTALGIAVANGKTLLHKVADDVRVLTDNNTFISFTKDKSVDFSKNQTIRILDQIAIDISTVFNKKYLGVMPNDSMGRTELWKDIVLHHENMQNLRAITNFKDSNVKVEMGENKNQVVITDVITPVNAMEQLYMSVIVG